MTMLQRDFDLKKTDDALKFTLLVYNFSFYLNSITNHFSTKAMPRINHKYPSFSYVARSSGGNASSEQYDAPAPRRSKKAEPTDSSAGRATLTDDAGFEMKRGIQTGFEIGMFAEHKIYNAIQRQGIHVAMVLAEVSRPCAVKSRLMDDATSAPSHGPGVYGNGRNAISAENSRRHYRGRPHYEIPISLPRRRPKSYNPSAKLHPRWAAEHPRSP